jgi:hypothetical protein
VKAKERGELLQTLTDRFRMNMNRHPDVAWDDVYRKLDANPDALRSVLAMQSSGGEPDVIAFAAAPGTFIFCDCSAETPTGRRSLCYDLQALNSRKAHKPTGSAVETAAAMGVELLDESQYRHLQTLGEFDTKTSSWLKTPHDIRHLGGALFGDRRYGKVFVYHNGAQSYYEVRGFRALRRV